MSFLLGILVGIASVFAAFVLLTVIAEATRVGYTIECRCGYVTGDFETTPRAITGARWTWHRAAHGLGIARFPDGKYR